MTQAMDHLRAEVARAQSVMASATTLISTIAGHIRDNAEDPVALNALADQLDQSAAGLASAVTENTAAANLGGDTTAPVGQPTDTGSNEPAGGATDTGSGDATGAGTDTGGASGTDTTGAGSSDASSGGTDTGSTDTTQTSGDEQP